MAQIVISGDEAGSVAGRRVVFQSAAWKRPHRPCCTQVCLLAAHVAAHVATATVFVALRAKSAQSPAMLEIQAFLKRSTYIHVGIVLTVCQRGAEETTRK